MRAQISALGRRAARAVGLEVRRVSEYSCPMIRLSRMLAAIGTDVVIDVGANEGQFVTDLRKAGYRGRVVSIEPLAKTHDALCRFARADSRWQVLPRCALGSKPGTAVLHIAGNSVSSSLRDMTDAHLAAAAESRYCGTESVDVATLDGVVAEYGGADHSRIFVKLDVQGHESAVLEGGVHSVGAIGALQLEMSLVELYSGQSLMFDQVPKLVSSGFELWSLDRGFMDGRTGRLLQCDVTFLRRSLVGSVTHL